MCFSSFLSILITTLWGAGVHPGLDQTSSWPLPTLPAAMGTPVPRRHWRRSAATSQAKPIPVRAPLSKVPPTPGGLWLPVGSLCRSPCHIHRPELGKSLHRQTLGASSPSHNTSLCPRDCCTPEVSWGGFSALPPYTHPFPPRPGREAQQKRPLVSSHNKQLSSLQLGALPVNQPHPVAGMGGVSQPARPHTPAKLGCGSQPLLTASGALRSAGKKGSGDGVDPTRRLSGLPAFLQPTPTAAAGQMERPNDGFAGGLGFV